MAGYPAPVEQVPAGLVGTVLVGGPVQWIAAVRCVGAVQRTAKPGTTTRAAMAAPAAAALAATLRAAALRAAAAVARRAAKVSAAAAPAVAARRAAAVRAPAAPAAKVSAAAAPAVAARRAAAVRAPAAPAAKVSAAAAPAAAARVPAAPAAKLSERATPRAQAPAAIVNASAAGEAMGAREAAVRAARAREAMATSPVEDPLGAGASPVARTGTGIAMPQRAPAGDQSVAAARAARRAAATKTVRPGAGIMTASLPAEAIRRMAAGDMATALEMTTEAIGAHPAMRALGVTTATVKGAHALGAYATGSATGPYAATAASEMPANRAVGGRPRVRASRPVPGSSQPAIGPVDRARQPATGREAIARSDPTAGRVALGRGAWASRSATATARTGGLAIVRSVLATETSGRVGQVLASRRDATKVAVGRDLIRPRQSMGKWGWTCPTASLPIS